MKSVQMKVVGWDEDTLSLIVKFAYADDTEGIDVATPLSYQPYNMFPDVDDVQDLAKRLAVSGITICDQKERLQAARADTAKKEQLASLVGETFEYTLEDLLTNDSA